MALRGLRPVVEIMFGDFITLIADQLINHIAKFRWMYNDQVRVPMVIRTPMGGRRGYGPTHSQTLEKLFLGVPGIQVVAPAALCLMDGSGSPGAILYQAILDQDDPLIFIENKLQYLLPVQNQSDLDDFLITTQYSNTELKLPTYKLTIKDSPTPKLTMAAYGYMAELAKQAAVRLAYEHEIFVELVISTQLSPFEVASILHSTNQTGNLLIIEEGNLTLGWGAEVLARVSEASHSPLDRVRRLAAKNLPVPSSGPLEAQVLPDVDQIIETAIEISH
jgi:pyruvate/2-oxoglutarate/acetoin dehydrogenase E1 component